MARIEEVKDTLKKAKSQQPAILKYYLVTYNLLNALGWSYILVCTILHVFDLDSKAGSIRTLSQNLPFFSPPSSSPTWGSALGWVDRPAEMPDWAVYVEKYVVPWKWMHGFRRMATTGERLGWQTTVVQTFAILEVVHSLLGWVRSPLITVAMQVASRYYAIYGINYLFPHTLQNPLYTTMILSWSLTEVVRYVFYALNLLGHEPYALLWTRYTTFWLLYPTGASSEAFLIFSTLPTLKEKPFVDWSFHDWFRLAMFCTWWPSLYVLYTHMIKQRRRVLAGPGRTLGAKPKSL
ncbi:tyrosine phosphatase-like protein [Cytidiella melzeri]|nr:tyrosine phosphatase-like protein [Cytidiella melzeri]